MTQITDTSHFDLLILRSENWDILLKLFKNSVADFSFCKKKMISSPHVVYRKSLLQTFKLLILLGFLFILMKAI